jgi:hypothetical protein
MFAESRSDEMKPICVNSVVVGVVGLALVVTFRPAPAPPEADRPAIVVTASAMVPELVRLRIAAKDRLAREVAAGTRSLLDAAALFRELNRLPPTVGDPAPDAGVDAPISIPGRTDDERRCQEVLLYVHAAFNHGSERDLEPVKRVAAEFFRILHDEGGIRLPDPPSAETVRDVLERTAAGLKMDLRRDLLRNPLKPAPTTVD